MFRLAPLLITAAAVSDETSLMQGVKPQHVTVKEEKSKSVSNLLETAKTMLKNGATPDVVTFAQATLAEITGTVLPKIQDAHDADQRLVDQTVAMFTDARLELEAGNDIIAGLYRREVSESDEHRECRGTGSYGPSGSWISSETRTGACTNEYCTCEDKRDCDYELWRIWEHFVCEEEVLRDKSDEIERHFCVETANGTTWGFRDYSVARFPSWIDQKRLVDEWEAQYEPVRSECASRYSAMDRKTGDCDADQQKLEETSCELANKVREVNNHFADFWVWASETYQSVMDEVRCLEIDRWKESRALATVECLLQATSDRNGRPCEETTDGFEAEVARCEGTHWEQFQIEYHEIPGYPPGCAALDAVGYCVHVDRVVPCTAEYDEQEYHGLWQPPQPNFKAPDYDSCETHAEPVTHVFARCLTDESAPNYKAWSQDIISHICAFVDGSGTCDCPEFDRSPHHGSFQALRTGNSHCNQRAPCVPCTLEPESQRCEIINFHQHNDGNSGRTHPWVRYPIQSDEDGEFLISARTTDEDGVQLIGRCSEVTRRQMEGGTFTNNNVNTRAHDAPADGRADYHFTPNADLGAPQVPTYMYGDVNSGNFCPTAADVSEAECLAAVQALLPTGQVQGRADLVTGTWGHVPPGCSVQSHFTHNREGDWAAHYNSGRGTNDGGYTKVCAGPRTQYHVFGYGMPNCPEGKTIDTREECEQAHISLGLEVSPTWTGNLASIPGLCSTREVDWGGGHHFHFNSNSVGTIRVDLSPVCKV